MAVFKCKMCGGTLEIKNNETVAVCEYCGTKQTLPKLDDDRKANLYDRANHFRRNNEFDKAMGIYEQILNEDSTDAESYWSLVLCRYGIEYVEDPATHKRIPTVNRTQYTSIFDDEDYKSALQYADGSQKEVYEAEANAINEIQKGILAISGKEEPFDVFICYKETDQNGRRTPDSVLAAELYHELTREGFKVFFSRITLEDKLGQEYEPYIFAALNSAKVMVVLGTKPEYFNAVWVKNEWNRYLALIKNGARKVLIPAFKDMDPYDLPEEFSHLQAQDMSKLGFMQDLIRGIKKLTQADETKEPSKETVVVNANTNIAPLLKRAFMFLEDGDWNSANEYCEKVLDIDPECAEAYLGKLMAELKVLRQEDLADCEQPFDENNNYKKTVRFADEKLSKTLKGYISHINERNENARLEGIYSQSVRAMNGAITQTDYEQAAQAFEAIESYKNSSELAKECRENADICRKDDIYNTAKMLMNGTNESAFTAAIEKFEEISGWKDADELIVSCHSKIEEIKAKEELDRLEAERKAEEKRLADEKAAKRHKRVSVISIALVSILIAFVILLTTFIIPNNKYNSAITFINKKEYIAAYNILIDLGNFKDSKIKISEIEISLFQEIVRTAKIGDSIEFGTYEQDNNTSNGKEKIEWIIVSSDDKKAMLLSKYCLDYQPYHSEETNITWENCTLRNWLNNSFANEAFDDNEQSILLSTNVSNSYVLYRGWSEQTNIDTGKDTVDKIFLLTPNEVNKYCTSSTVNSSPTTYAKSQGAYAAPIGGGTNWALRSPGYDQDKVRLVLSDNDQTFEHGILDIGCQSVAYKTGVRPAMWVDISN